MKMKLKLDSAKFKEFFINQGEKLALGLGVILFGWLCYSALQTKGYKMQPGQLLADSKRIDEMIKDTPWKPLDYGVRIPDPEYKVQAEKAMVKIDPLRFGMNMSWSPTLQDLRVRRAKPNVIAAKKPQAEYRFGAVAQKKDVGSFAGRTWITVTALAPYGEQLAEYRLLFDNAIHQVKDKDIPRYNTFVVERAVVVPGAPSNELKWEPFDEKANAALRKGLTAGNDCIDKKFQDKFLAEPCLTLVGAKNGPEVAHDPEIPFIEPVEVKVENAAAAPAADEGEVKKGLLDEEQKNQNQTNNNQNATLTPVVAEVVDYKLVRFFDFTVEPNKTYVYRVKLQLVNPNHGIPQHYLKSPDLAEARTLDTEFSEPTVPVTIPNIFRVLGGDVSPARNQLLEAKCKMLIVQRSPEFGVEVGHEFTLERGSIMNYNDISTQIPVAGQVDKYKDGPMTFQTGYLMIDMVGGDELTSRENPQRRYRLPSEELLAMPDGKILARSSIDQGGDYDSHRPPKARAAAPAATEPGTPADPSTPAASGDLFNTLLKGK